MVTSYLTFTFRVVAAVSTVILTVIAFKRKDAFTKMQKIFTPKLKIFLLDILLFFFTATWLLIASFPYGCLLFTRWSVLCYLKVRYGTLGSLVEGLDAIGTVDSPKCRQIIKALKILKGSCDIDDLRQKCEATVSRKHVDTGKLVYPKFYQYLNTCFGYYCWKPSNFDIKHHVRYYDYCDITLDESISENKVMELISMNANQPFEKGRANWEILIIPKFHYKTEINTEESERCDMFALIIRISHGVGDGFSLMKLIMRDIAGETENCIPISKSKETSWIHKIIVFLYVFCTSPRSFYSEMMLKDINPFHNDQTELQGDKKILWSDPLSVEWLKKIKNSNGLSMNALLLGALTGACRRYMVEERNLDDESVPEKISALIPMPAANHPDNTMCNKFSAIMFPLESKSPDIFERYKAIDNQCRISASSPDAPVNLFLMNLIGVAPVDICKYFINNTQTTIVVSNLPGPSHTIRIWGKELLDTMFWLPTVGESGISVSFLSYKTHLRIGITVDTGIIPEGADGAKKLLNYIIHDIKSLSRTGNKEDEYLVDILKGSYIVKIDKNCTIQSHTPMESELLEDSKQENLTEEKSSPFFEKVTYCFENSVVKTRHGLSNHIQL